MTMQTLRLLGAAAALGLGMSLFSGAAQAADASNMLNDALKAAKELEGAGSAAPKPGAQSGAPPEPLADNPAPAPVPSDAEEVEYDAAEGALEFKSPSGVKVVADFYRRSMKNQGWTDHPTPIAKDNFVVLDFSKGAQRIELTVMRMGDRSEVSLKGDALKGSDSAGERPAASPTPEVELTAEEVGGLPVPSPRSASGSESSLFRSGVNAQTPASVASVVAFYRRELGKRGWTERADKASVRDDGALLAFNSPGGPAVLKLDRDGSDTTVLLSVRDRASALKSPLWPKPGQIKIAFGNITGKAAEVTVAGKKVRIAAGAGTNAPDGPTLDLPPGKHDFALKSGGRELIDAASEDIWMMMVGPGGLLAVQAY